jgi:hypothetical protein
MGVTYHDIGRQNATFSEYFAKKHQKQFFYPGKEQKTKGRKEKEIQS